MISTSQKRQLVSYVQSLVKRAEAGDTEAIRTLGAMNLLKASLEK